MMTEKAAIWLRVSQGNGKQTTDNQLSEVMQLVSHRGWTVTARYEVNDSASNPGAEYKKIRAQMLADSHAGKWRYLVCWAADRVSRLGIEDLLSIVRQLRESGNALVSVQEPWLNGDPATGELLTAISAWIAAQESMRRSERVKVGMARAKAQGKAVGGRKAGARDRRPRKTDGYRAEQARRRARREAAQAN
jgi:DNA invertase Pin-like site-specific DNA recombinase